MTITGWQVVVSAKRLRLSRLLVVVGIIIVMLALLLPSVREAREPARRNSCLNNFKDLSIAL